MTIDETNLLHKKAETRKDGVYSFKGNYWVGKLKIGKIKFTFVFRHKWDNQDEIKYNSEFRDYSIGLWFKRSRIVGSKNFSKPKEWGDNLVNDYMIGVNLIICKMWVSFNRGGMPL